MFKNLYRKIYLPILLISLVLILFIDTFAIVLQADTLNDSYRSNGERTIARALDSFKLYISSAAAFTYNLSLDEEIIAKLVTPDAKSITAKLDTVCNYSLKMDAAALYAVDGTAYTSSTITQIPSLDELKTTPEISEFILGEQSSAISMRTQNLAGVYYNLPYPAASGVITCCQKVYDGETVVGYIFTDILPANLYGYIFAEGQFKNAIAFISANGNYFEYAGNSAHSALLKSDDSAYFKYSKKTSDGLFTITVFDSKHDYNMQVLKLALIMIGVSVALIVFVVIASRLTAKSVTSRLDGLAQKMASQQMPEA